jgi:queuine/archaeosine tRNA-ribosyltransferase
MHSVLELIDAVLPEDKRVISGGYSRDLVNGVLRVDIFDCVLPT